MKLLKLCLCCCLYFAVFACGGGGGGNDSVPPIDNNNDDNPPPVDPQAANYRCGSLGASVTGDDDPGSFVLFEGGAVRPLAWSTDGSKLYVTNTPANCLEIYSVSDAGFVLDTAVPVGLEPVAVAVRNNTEVWVINHLSDSVSVVDVSDQPVVSRTLQLGDEPRDIVFAGENNNRVFISASYRGQNHPEFDPDDLTTAGLGRADIWVYDVNNIDDSLNGGPLTIVNLFADTPRALTVSADGSAVYAAAFLSGNGTTTLDQETVVGAKPLPNTSADGAIAPATGLIVKKVAGSWVDENGTDWGAEVNFELPDYDVFVIDAMAATPAVTERISGIGTTLFNMAVNPVSGEIYVSNLEALNHIRFEGPGGASTTVRGHIAESRISVIDAGAVTVNHLNPHIDFDVEEGTAYAASDVAKSISQPLNLQVSPDGETLYVAAFGSSKVVALPTSQLHSGSYTPDSNFHIELEGGGPSGMALSNDGSRLAVYTRFDNRLSYWNTAEGVLLASQSLFTPEPAAVIAGRPFLYDATLTSANGTSACSSCHIFADNDGLAWDLGNPDASLQFNPNNYVANSPITTINFHSLKGPMTTQTFRGISDSGPQHWRGDRTGQNRVEVNGVLESIEAAAFKEFGPAFTGLVGAQTELSNEQMQSFTDFSLALTPPPNPVRNLDNTLTQLQQAGRDIYFNVNSITGIGSCNHCHQVDVNEKHFGTSGLMSFEGGRVSENFKIPHLRNAYQKVGMFGTSLIQGGGVDMGAQIKGFGFLHDGSTDTLDNFFQDGVFVFPAPVATNRADVIRFVMVMDSNLAPIVGQQVTINANSSATALTRLTLLENRAQVTTPRPECDLIVSGMLDGEYYSALFQANNSYAAISGTSVTADALQTQLQTGSNSLTFTCVPPGSGRRMALNQTGQ